MLLLLIVGKVEHLLSPALKLFSVYSNHQTVLSAPRSLPFLTILGTQEVLWVDCSGFRLFDTYAIIQVVIVIACHL